MGRAQRNPSIPAPSVRRAWRGIARPIAAGCWCLMCCILSPASAAVDGPGDYRDGYASADYRTRSLALSGRVGREADLLALTRDPPLGLPPLPVPADNPLTAEKIALGRKLFYDRRLSLNGTQSCAMCHIPEQGFTNNELTTAVGLEGRDVGRNAPTLYNVAYLRRLFHDGRERSLEHQAWQPMINPLEMANPSIGVVLERLRTWPDYAGRFESAFAGRPASMESVGQAIASYERTLLSADSPFDRWYFGGERDALSASARRGFTLFTGRAGCSGCHTIGERSALFTDQELHNTGVGYPSPNERGRTEPRRVLLAPGVYGELSAAALSSVSRPRRTADLGRYRITRDPADRWSFRTPSLRNVALTAPYMHDGRFLRLEEVVAFYDRGGVSNPLQDPRIRPLGLTARESRDLVAFLTSLTGAIETLVLDAFAAPIGDVGSERRPSSAE
ncbi:Cytochrome-c peroxidase [Thiorhodococcus drewsii AZ1]|uniref:Cytochrome-c peroxidase n=1 Tax=Thiorhodococcus drewsii AZ1 TaxID=765913 RepID=G2DWY3_9GAMM|nr:cytochrome c peroxidase [Thiorhodococcus drewsii]EGV33337.1 Cytochrome-c peroxidase [Thiorhodococcus drewsii AZ1]